VVISIGIDTARKPLEELLNESGRFGGPTEFGWHTREASFRCWREHHLVSSEQPNPAARRQYALAVGTIVHEFLAAYYAAHIQTGQTSRLDGEMQPQQLYINLVSNGYSDEAIEAKRIFDAYLVKYNNKDSYLTEDVKIIAIEHHVRREFPWGPTHTARADMVLKMPDGYWIVDHKTTAARSAEFVEGWQIDPGILGLLWACETEFQPIRGVSINGIIKTKTPDFDRFMYAKDDRMINDYLAMMQFKSNEEKRAEDEGWPPTFSACFRKMGPHVGKCRFFERCVYGVTS
jgi:hypothetical protein